MDTGSPLSGQHTSIVIPSHPQRQIGQHSTKYHSFFSVFLVFWGFGFVLLIFDEDAFHDEKERTVASAGCMLEELKIII